MPKKIKVYGSPLCSFCYVTKRYFESKGLPFDYYDVSSDRSKAEEAKKISGMFSLPVVTIGDNVLVGYHKDKMDELLKEDIKEEVKEKHPCSNCGSEMVQTGACRTCPNCGCGGGCG